MKKDLQLKMLEYSHSHPSLWTEIGRFCADREVSKELGINITSNDNCSWFLAFIDNRLIGFCCAENKKDHIVFKHDFVVKSFRNNGVYKELFKFRLLSFKDKRIKSVCNENSIGTYLLNGFKLTGINGKYKKVIKHEKTN